MHLSPCFRGWRSALRRTRQLLYLLQYGTASSVFGLRNSGIALQKGSLSYQQITTYQQKEKSSKKEKFYINIINEKQT
jgi:hypothetical protein